MSPRSESAPGVMEQGPRKGHRWHRSRRRIGAVRGTTCGAALSLLLLGVPPSSAGTSVWTVDDVVLQESAVDWELSRDGSVAVWVRESVVRAGKDHEETPVSNLWLSVVAEGTSRQLTRGIETASSPRFSPDGRWIAFLSDRDVPGTNGELGERQLWVIPTDGGEARPLTRLERSVRELGWIDDRSVAFLAQERPSVRERRLDEAGDTSEVVENVADEPPVRLFKVGLEKGEVRRVTTNQGWIDTLAVSPDGRRAFVRVQRSLSWEFDARLPPVSYLVDLASGDQRKVLLDSDLIPQDVRWSTDGAGLYLLNDRSSHPVYRSASVTELWWFDPDAGQVESVDLASDRGVGGGYAVVNDGVIVLVHAGVRYRPVRVTRTDGGWRASGLQGERAPSLDRVVASASGMLAYRSSSATTPPQWYAARLDGSTLRAERRLTSLNPELASKPTGRVDVVRWTGAAGDTVEGLLHYPLDWVEGQRRPLVLSIHGGPAGVDRDTWTLDWAEPLLLWRERGLFVLEVNYHGSTGYGLEWVESIGGGRYYELEIPDLEAGVDAMIARGLADPERLGTVGWSNGGILSAELITRTDRYRVASIGAADVEWISDWANVDFGASFDNYYFGGPPWEMPDVYVAKSPFFRLEEVTTPTLVLTGTDDRNVPPHQSWSLFRALQQIGVAPVRLVLFPDEPHGLTEVAHQRRKIEEELAWLDRYLFGDTGAEPTAVPEGSLLAGLLGRAVAARTDDGALGWIVDGTLVPETVGFEGLEIGRFEVTCSQWAAFEPASGGCAGDVDLPVTGVSFDRAQAYVRWLAGITGRPFRLPTAAEAERLAAKAGTDGNTLDRWLGLTANPDDVERVEAALERLSPAALLRPVGHSGGDGDPVVFDLDGNAAEWAVGEHGAGVVVGPSADRPADPLGTTPAGKAYTGLRVVVDAD